MMRWAVSRPHSKLLAVRLRAGSRWWCATRRHPTPEHQRPRPVVCCIMYQHGHDTDVRRLNTLEPDAYGLRASGGQLALSRARHASSAEGIDIRPMKQSEMLYLQGIFGVCTSFPVSLSTAGAGRHLRMRGASTVRTAGFLRSFIPY